MNQFDLLNSNSLDSIFSAVDNVSNSAFTKKYKINEDSFQKIQDISQNINSNVNDNFPYETNLPDKTQHINKILSNNKSDKINRYRKYINTAISIDSKDRNIKKYPFPNKYQIFFNKNLKNVVSISLLDIKIPNSIPPVNSCNNRLQWCVAGCGEYNIRIPVGFYNIDQFAHKIKDYMDGQPIATGCSEPIDYYIAVNKHTHTTTIISRFESMPIIEISTIQGVSELTIIVENEINIAGFFIPTEIPSIGGLPNFIINNKEYKYQNPTGPSFNGPNIINNPGPNPTTTFSYVLKIYNGIDEIKATTTVNQIITEEIYGNKLFNKWPKIGRGVEILLKNSCDSLMNLLGWDYIPKDENKIKQANGINHNILCALYRANVKCTIPSQIVENYCKKHCNFDIVEKNLDVYKSINTNIRQIADCCYDFEDGFEIEAPYNYIQMDANGDIRGENYIFMRLKTCARSEDVISNNIIKATSEKQETVDTSDIFAKIILTSTSNDLSNFFITNRKIFYFNTLYEIDNLLIEFVDRNGKPIRTISNHHMTFEIIEKLDILNNTHFDSRTGDIVDVGEDDTLGNLFN
jgi:hypothetical protein